MSTHPNSRPPQLVAAAKAASGAAALVFTVAVGVAMCAVPMWAAHVAEYDKGDHVNDMFGDPAAWLLMLAALVLTPVATAVFGAVGAIVALVRRYKLRPLAIVVLFAILGLVSLPTGYALLLSLDQHSLPLTLSVLVSASILAAGAATGAAAAAAIGSTHRWINPRPI